MNCVNFTMEKNKTHFRHILLLCFREGKTTMEARQRICDLYGEDSISKSRCYYWYTRFRSGDFSVNDSPRSGRPTVADDDQILELIRADKHITSREIGKRLGVDFSTVTRRLKCNEW